MMFCLEGDLLCVWCFCYWWVYFAGSDWGSFFGPYISSIYFIVFAGAFSVVFRAGIIDYMFTSQGIGRSQVSTMATGIALNVMQTIALMGMMTALCRQILRGMSRERIHDRDCFSCTHVLSTLAKEHPGKILELYPLLNGSLMILD